MRTRFLWLSLISLSIIMVFTACAEVESEIKAEPIPTAAPTTAPKSQKTILGITSKTNCLFGPHADYGSMQSLDVGQYFEIVAIDDDITWIDDDITWFQINPNAVIDPTPPYRPINELSPQPDPPGSALVVHCWVPGNMAVTSGDLSKLPVIHMPVLRLIRKTNCFSGPNNKYNLVKVLSEGQYFGIIGIDDDITWIDDDITWFQISLNAIVDPNPPHRPLNQTYDQSGVTMTLRCWVPDGNVKFSGDLSSLPILEAPPLPTPTPIPPKPCNWNPNLQKCV